MHEDLREIKMLVDLRAPTLLPSSLLLRLIHFFSVSLLDSDCSFDCQACFISHQNYSFILPSSVLGGVKWYLEITHKTLETLLFTFSTLQIKFLKLQEQVPKSNIKPSMFLLDITM